MWLWIIGCAVVFAACNRLRGSVNYLVWVPSAVLGTLVWWASRDWIAAGLAAGAFVAGESFGWTKWINAIPGHLTQAAYNKKWLADKTGYEGPAYVAGWLADEATDYKRYVMVGMIVRGVYWWAPVFAVLWWFELVPWLVAVVAVVALSVAFPLAYKVGYRIDVGDFGYLQKAEIVYGAVYGAVLGAALFWL